RLGCAGLQRSLRPVAGKENDPDRPATDRFGVRGIGAVSGAELMPPALIRRPVTVTVWLAVSAACVIASPLLLGIGMAASALTGRRQPAVVARLIVAYFAHELGALVACGALWLAAGAGWRINGRRSQRLHWRLVRWFFGGLAASGRHTLEIDVQPDPS